MRRTRIAALVLSLAVLSLNGCSIRRFAMTRVADALSSGGTTFESDDDLQLVGDALPFGLKLYESLLEQTPKHKGLLLAACQGFASYSYLYVHSEADRIAEDDIARAKPMQTRARRLYLRALGYCHRSLESAYPGIVAKLSANPRSTLEQIRKKEDVPYLYWTAVSLGLAISVSKNDTDMLARVPEVEAMIDHAVKLDEPWREGTLREFQLTFAGAKPGGVDYNVIADHYRRTLQLSAGKRAGIHVAYAESWALPQQKRTEFEEVLKKALAIDPDRDPPTRLLNILAQERARRLLERIDVLLGPSSSSTQE